MSRKKIGKVILVIILGAVLGSLLGQLIGLILPEGVVKEFFLRSGAVAVGPGTLDLKIFSITLGFSLTVNVVGFIGIAVAIYLLRWY